MTALQAILYPHQKAYRFEMEVIESAANAHRAMMIAAYCAQIRLWSEADRLNAFHKDTRWRPAPPRPEWCNAAVLLLSAAEDEVWRFYLAADPNVRNNLVIAVMTDGGIWRGDHFSELPPL